MGWLNSVTPSHWKGRSRNQPEAGLFALVIQESAQLGEGGKIVGYGKHSPFCL